MSDSRDLATWFDGKPADIVLMHFGTNDVWNNIAPATILQAYTTILGRLRGANPNVRVLVAQDHVAGSFGMHRLPDARDDLEQHDSGLGDVQRHRGVADNGRRSEHGLQPRAPTPGTACTRTPAVR